MRRALPPTSSAPPAPRPAPGTSLQPLLQRVEPSAQPGVDGPTRQPEQRGELAGRVLEQVAQDDHGAVLRRETAQLAQELVVALRPLGCGCVDLLRLEAQ